MTSQSPLADLRVTGLSLAVRTARVSVPEKANEIEQDCAFLSRSSLDEVFTPYGPILHAPNREFIALGLLAFPYERQINIAVRRYRH